MTHVRRHHEHYHTRGGGHLYQGRFKSFPVQDDGHFLTVCRYVEANALRAGMVPHAEDWAYSGLAARRANAGELPLCDWSVDRPANWIKLVNAVQELAGLQTSVNRSRPYGSSQWVLRPARRLGLAFTLRDPGRPGKVVNNE